MKRRYWCLVFFIIVIFSSNAQNNSSSPMAVYSGPFPVDFSITLRELQKAVVEEINTQKLQQVYCVLDGDIASIMVRSDTEDQFIAEVELVNGMWKGEDAVEIYRIYVIFDGIHYRQYFSPQAPGHVIAGKTILVLGKYAGVATDYDGSTPVAVVEAKDVRLLE